MSATTFSHARYQKGAVLGQGAQGVVFRVVDREAPSRALVAKLWHAGTFGDDVLAGEFALLSRLRQPGLVRAHDLGRDEITRAPFFVEDFVDGPDADAWVAAEPDPARRAARLAHVLAEVATALASLHDAGFLHGDLKPPHVRISAGDRPILLDLGAAVARARAAESPRALTLGYAAPELLAGAPASPSTDLFALGALSFAVATGQPPELGPRRPLRASAPWVPPSVADVIESLLAEHPADRPSGARDVLARLGEKRAPAWAPAPAPLGREDALAAIALPTSSGVRYVVGESGAGKSHLAREAWTRALLSGRAARFVAFPEVDPRLSARLVAFLRGDEGARPFGAAEPLLLFLDDLEAAPTELREALDLHRCRPRDAGGLVIVATAREAPAGAESLVLGVLPDAAMRALCEASLDPSSGVDCEELVRAARGNPGWLLASLGHVPLTPASVEDRARALSLDARRALATIAVVGGVAPEALARAILGDRAARALAESSFAALVTRRASAGGVTWALASAPVAVAVATALGDRALVDAVADAALSGALLGTSMLLALAEGPHRPTRRAELLRAAALRARREALRGEEIAALLALAEDARTRTTAELVRLERLTRDAGTASAHPQVINWLDEAARVDPRVRPLALRRRAEERARSGDHAGAEAAARGALEAAREAGDVSAEAFAHATVGLVLLYRAEWEAAHEELREARALVAAGDAVDDPEETARLEHNLGVVAIYRGAVAEAIEAFERSLAKKLRLGDRAGTRACLRNLGYALVRSGRLDEAARTLDEALALARSLGQASGRAWCLSARAEVEIARGDAHGAERFVAEAEALGDAVPAAVRGDLAILRAECEILAGDGAAALASLARVDDVLRASDALVDARAAIATARALLACVPARRRDAARAASSAVRRARGAGLPEPEAEGLRVLASLRLRAPAPRPVERGDGGHERALASWLDEVAGGASAADAALSLARFAAASSGAERAFVVIADELGETRSAWGVDVDGLAIEGAEARVPAELVREAFLRDAPVYVPRRTTAAGTGAALACASPRGPGRRAAIVLEHRFAPHRFDGLSADRPRTFATLSGVVLRLFEKLARPPSRS